MVRPWPSAIVVSVIIEGFDRDSSGRWSVSRDGALRFWADSSGRWSVSR